jgi:hypothetical protein
MAYDDVLFVRCESVTTVCITFPAINRSVVYAGGGLKQHQVLMFKSPSNIHRNDIEISWIGIGIGAKKIPMF